MRSLGGRGGRRIGRATSRLPYDWRPFQVERHPSWCGHPVPKVYVPMDGAWWQEILVLEEGLSSGNGE